MKTRIILAAVLVIVVSAITMNVMLSTHIYAAASTNEKIQIPQWGATAVGGVDGPYTLTVSNTGSVPVTIATIEVDGNSYAYSSTATPGTFSASTNQIAAGQSVTFTITTMTPAQTDGSEYVVLNFTAVTTNGANATAQAMIDLESTPPGIGNNC